MQIEKTKILLFAFIFPLSFTSQACLLEHAFGLIVTCFQHEPHGAKADKHGHAAPSHKHDQKGHEGDFCCDNSLCHPLAGKTASDFKLIVECVSSSLSLAGELWLDSSVPHFFVLDSRRPSWSRARDKYALSCLLHAPPFV